MAVVVSLALVVSFFGIRACQIGQGDGFLDNLVKYSQFIFAPIFLLYFLFGLRTILKGIFKKEDRGEAFQKQMGLLYLILLAFVAMQIVLAVLAFACH